MMSIIYSAAEEWNKEDRFWPRGYRPRSVEHRAAQATKTFESLWRYTIIRLLCILGIHWEGIVVSGNLGCCTLCGEILMPFLSSISWSGMPHGRILPRN